MIRAREEVSPPPTPTKMKALLILSNLINAGLGFFAFVIMGFATSPNDEDVTMRVGFYVLNAVIIAAVASVIMPWICTAREHPRRALLFSLLPVLLLSVTAIAFLLLDNWLNRTFS